MDFFKFFSKKQGTRDIARDRLKLVLTHDRANCSPQLLEMIRDDILKVISKYVEIDEAESDVSLSQDDTAGASGAPVLSANIAIKSMRRPGS